MRAANPTLVDPTVDQGAHLTPCAEIWYVTCLVNSGDHHFATQAILTTSPSGRLFSMVSMLDLAGGAPRHATTAFSADQVEVEIETLKVRCPVATLAGSADELSLQASLAADGFALDLRRAAPVLNACGTGVFPYFDGPTHQYSFPALDVSGTVTFDGTCFPVNGAGWYDRQWSESRQAFGNANPFTWLGLCLTSGDNLSIWDTQGRTWATVGHPDGTHTVTAVDLEERSDHYSITVPFFGSTLEVGHRCLHHQGPFYTGVCELKGLWRGAAAEGYGFVDRVAS